MSDSLIQTGLARPWRALVFDSGVGGLSVLREVAALLPDLQLIYAADNAAFPYGLKTEAELVARVSQVIRLLVDRVSPDIVVIACNTASTTALDAVRKFLAVPVIGVVPAIKPAAQSSKTRRVGLLGTNATVASPYTRALIAEFAADCAVLTCGAPELVEAAERKLQGFPADDAPMRAALGRLFGQPDGGEIDTVVLGCTHFPLLLTELAVAAPFPVAWLDSGAAIARRVKTILAGSAGATLSPAPCHRALFTLRTPAVERMRPGLAGFGLDQIDYIEPLSGSA